MTASGFTMPFMQALGIEVVAAGGGQASLRLSIRADHLNGFDGAHGGLIAALIDVAVGAAAAIDPDGPGLKVNQTLSLTTLHFGPAPREGILIARARRRGGGSRIVFVDAEVRDAAETLIATGTATLRYRNS
jgi:uncharacterized protein (TIGR00369 family)